MRRIFELRTGTRNPGNGCSRKRLHAIDAHHAVLPVAAPRFQPGFPITIPTMIPFRIDLLTGLGKSFSRLRGIDEELLSGETRQARLIEARAELFQTSAKCETRRDDHRSGALPGIAGIAAFGLKPIAIGARSHRGRARRQQGKSEVEQQGMHSPDTRERHSPDTRERHSPDTRERHSPDTRERHSPDTREQHSPDTREAA